MRESNADTRLYKSDDDAHHSELAVFSDEKGRWWVAIVPEGMTLGPAVRFDGGAVAGAVAQLYRAMGGEPFGWTGRELDTGNGDPLHPFGRCTCCGEGRCAWCTRPCAVCSKATWCCCCETGPTYTKDTAAKPDVDALLRALVDAAEGYLFRSVPDPNVGADAEDRLREAIVAAKGGSSS